MQRRDIPGDRKNAAQFASRVEHARLHRVHRTFHERRHFAASVTFEVGQFQHGDLFCRQLHQRATQTLLELRQLSFRIRFVARRQFG